MPAVAVWKLQNDVPITDPGRERAVTTRAEAVAATMGLAPQGIRTVFGVQIRAARDAQSHFQDRWRQRDLDFPGPVPSLTAELRPKLDRITVDFLRALYLAAPELARADFVTIYAASLDELRASGWTEADKHELLAALATVHKEAIGPPVLERVAAAGTLRVGTTGDYAPFSLEQAGVLSGADIDLAESLAERLGVKAVFVRTSWSGLLDDLRADKFDLAMGGISVTPARAAVGSFSIPYSSGGKTILARCEDATRFPALAAVDRRGVRVIVNPGGTNEQYVRKTIHRATIVVFGDNRSVFEEILAHRADVMITDDVEVELQTHRHPQLCRALSGTLTHSDKAILMPRDAKLVDRVNELVSESVESGETARVLARYLSQ